MRIIKEGKVEDPDPERTATCHSCKTEIGYNNKDIQSNFRNEIYVECPLCKSYMDAETAAEFRKANEQKS